MSVAPLNLGWWLVILLLGQELGHAQLRRLTGPSLPGQANALTIVWNPSPSPSVVGYAVYWGLSSETCTNRIAVRNVSSVTLVGLRRKATYHFAVAAYDANGEESPWSNRIQYSREPQPIKPLVGAVTNQLQMQQVNPTGTNPVLRLSFLGQAGGIYFLESTEDFQRWEVVCITNCVQNQLVVYDVPYVANSNSPQRFFRVQSE